MDIYTENIEFMKKNYPYIEWDEEEIERCREKEQDRIVLRKNAKQELLVEIEENGHIWSLGSRYDAEKAAECWANGFQNVNYRTLFIVIGIGSGIYIKKLHEKYPENNIILYEPDTGLLSNVLHELKISEILTKEVFFAVGKTGSALYMELIERLITYDNMKEVKFSSVPNYENADAVCYLAAKKHFVNCIERIIFKRNTLIVDEGIRRENLLHNLFWYPKGYSLGQLKDGVKCCKPEERAAIIVSAGPSLDKNVKELKKAKNKALIIAVDTALKTVLNAGIEPDLAVLIDPAKDPALFDREELRKIPLCISIWANKKIMELHHGKKFLATRDSDLMEEIAKKYKKDLYVMHSGGSVANNAFSVAGIMGFKKMILVGQDLAYPNGRIHTADAYENEERLVMSSRYFEVEDIYGGKVYTEANMDAYRRWYEEQIVFNSDCRVIDATEGGAKIKGAEILTLREAIEQECDKVEEVDFRGLIEMQEPLFSREEQEEIKRDYIEIEKRLVDMEKILKKQIETYQQLKRMDRNGDNSSKAFRKAVKEISRCTEKLDKNSLLELVRLYENQLEYDVLDELNTKSETKKSEVIKAADGGEQICKSYMQNIQQLKAEWHKLLEENHYI